MDKENSKYLHVRTYNIFTRNTYIYIAVDQEHHYVLYLLRIHGIVDAILMAIVWYVDI